MSVRGWSRTSSGASGDLGAGLVDVPPVPLRDPQSMVLADPHVPQDKRLCSRCGSPVGVPRGGRPAVVDGFCPVCGAGFSFTPKLAAGDLVAGQYDVAGALAHGGMGWLYLAQDRNVESRWVVLKGLLDAGDEGAMRAAIAERRFLAQVSHPNVVQIYNFVEHGGAGYIVMEYVNGSSLKQLRLDTREETGLPLPLDRSLAYGLEVLSALGFLHGRGLLYCDLKPDNVIQSGEMLKIIDLGGVRRADDDGGDVFGTTGYQAPEIAELGPSVVSDVFTVGRMLMALSIDLPGFYDADRWATEVPPAADVPLLAEFPAFDGLLRRATDPDPAGRFGSAGEMADQVFGVLRQVVASQTGERIAAPSRRFGPELVPDPSGPTWRSLPQPLADADDPAIGLVMAQADAPPGQVLLALSAHTSSAEVRLRRVRAHLDLGHVPQAWADLTPSVADPDGRGVDWRARWWAGLVGLADGYRTEQARTEFSAVAASLPGELAPRLARAVVDEAEAAAAPDGPGPRGRAGLLRTAADEYLLVARTDPAASGAAFGAARCLAGLGDRAGAADALALVPEGAAARMLARQHLCALLCAPLGGQAPSTDDLAEAERVLDDLAAHGATQTAVLALRRDLLGQRLGTLTADDRAVGVPPHAEMGVRAALEQTLRDLAALTPVGPERVRLVDEANAVRSWTRT